MTPDSIAAAAYAVLAIIVIGVLFAIVQWGKTAQRDADAKKTTDTMAKAREVERAVARESDPVRKLLDRWKRP